MFRHPEALLLFIVLIAYIGFIYRAKLSKERIIFSVSAVYKELPVPLSSYLFRLNNYLPFLSLVLVIIALAGPQKGFDEREVWTETRDIVIALDASGSMAAMDFEPNRLEKAKEVVKSFIRGRRGDRIGLVVFAGRAFTHCPITLDYDILMDYVDNVHLKMIEDGTAIGNAIATSVNRLHKSDAKSRIIILLTDGESNRGNITPLAGAEMAKVNNIKIHTIGVGSEGAVKFPVDSSLSGRQYVYTNISIDEDLLKEIAEITQGSYYYVKDENMLKDVFSRIDREEQTLVQSVQYTVFEDRSRPFKVMAMLMLLCYMVLRLIYFTSIP